MFVSLYLCRLKDLRPVWARQTALIVRDMSEQTGNGGKRTPAPYVNAEYVQHTKQDAVQMVHTTHMHTELNPLISLRSWSCFSISMFLIEDIRTISMWAVCPVSFCLLLLPVFPLLQHLLALPSSWHQCLLIVFVSTGHFFPFHSLSLTLFQCQQLAQVMAAPWQKTGFLWSSSVLSFLPTYLLIPSSSLFCSPHLITRLSVSLFSLSPWPPRKSLSSVPVIGGFL